MPGMRDVPLEVSVGECAQYRAERPDTILLDVRESWERDIAALEGSLHIPMNEIVARASELDRDRPIYVLCHHGARSASVVRWMRANGFDQAINVAGGIHEWSQKVDPGIPTY